MQITALISHYNCNAEEVMDQLLLLLLTALAKRPLGEIAFATAAAGQLTWLLLLLTCGKWKKSSLHPDDDDDDDDDDVREVNELVAGTAAVTCCELLKDNIVKNSCGEEKIR
jgi:hypothetical protein